MTTATHTATAWLYLRVSTKRQAYKGGLPEGFSLPAQREACERLAADKELTVTREYVEKGYASVGFKPDVRNFITDMSSAYAESDLVLCRAGATTLAELTVCKKPAILIPFPAAADNHQVVNAKSLVDAGAAMMIE